MRITKNEMIFAITIAVLGFLLTTKKYLVWLDGLTPIEGLGVYYILLFISLYVLSKFGLIIHKFKMDSPSKVFGILLITFSFFIVLDWESPYVQHITGHSTATNDVSPILYQAEDGATFYVWTELVGIKDFETARILTYCVTPFVLILIGSLLVTQIKLGSL